MIVRIFDLTPISILFQSFNVSLHDVMVFLIHPAVHEVVLLHLRHVHKAVAEEGLNGVDEASIVYTFAYMVRCYLPALQRNPGLIATAINRDNASAILEAHQPYIYWALLNIK